MFLKKLIRVLPKDDFGRAIDLFNRGNYAKAVRTFESILAGESDAASDLDIETVSLYACEAHLGLANKHKEEGRIDAAIEEMERVLELKPTWVDVHNNLGELYCVRKEYPAAEERFRKAIELNPKYFRAHLNLTNILFLEDRSDESSEQLKIAAQFCPGFLSELMEELKDLAASNPDVKEWSALFERILVEQPSSVQVSRQVALDSIQNGDYMEAIHELKKAIAIEPDYADLHNLLGIAYGNEGMVDDSIEEFEIALKINPYFLKARLNMALSLFERSSYEEAHYHLKKVLEIKPDDELAINLLKELRAHVPDA